MHTTAPNMNYGTGLNLKRESSKIVHVWILAFIVYYEDLKLFLAICFASFFLGNHEEFPSSISSFLFGELSWSLWMVCQKASIHSKLLVFIYW